VTPIEMELPLACRCGRCEPAALRILADEATLCQGARAEVTRRRKRLQRQKKRELDRRRYRESKREAMR
jgi:hypothetical protein